MGSALTINWRYFSLEQVNSQQGPDWKAWEQPQSHDSRGMPAFRAAEAARRQGEDYFEKFHFALLDAKNRQGRDIADIKTLIEVAQNAGLNMARFESDLGDEEILVGLARDHTFATEKLGIFGTPTLVFAGRQPVFLKLSARPSAGESLDLFNELRHLIMGRRYVQEIKRTQAKTD